MADPVQTESRTAYLKVDGGATYEITSNTSVTIGRLDSNDIVLDDYKVSREHAVLKYAQGEFVLVDLASTHGTFLKGERIEKAVVASGETFNIVGHELSISWEAPRTATGESAATQLHRIRSLDRRLKFFGGLNEFPLSSLVTFLHQERQSGLLILENDQKTGPHIYFETGEITHVVESEISGKTFSELLTRPNYETTLFFYFHHETDFPSRTIFQSTPSYLRELCNEQELKWNEQGALLAHAKSNANKVTATMDLPLAPLPIAPLPPDDYLPPPPL